MRKLLINTNSEDLQLVPGLFMIWVKKRQWEKLSHKWDTALLWNKKIINQFLRKYILRNFFFAVDVNFKKLLNLVQMYTRKSKTKCF